MLMLTRIRVSFKAANTQSDNRALGTKERFSLHARGNSETLNPNEDFRILVPRNLGVCSD